MVLTKHIKGTVSGVDQGFLLYAPSVLDPSKKYPLIIYLHGMGERGDGSDGGLQFLHDQGVSWNLKAALDRTWKVDDQDFQFIMVAPQLSVYDGWWDPKYTNAIHKWSLENLPVDATRIYLTGISLGGGGVWSYIDQSIEKASSIAAAVPICGVEGYSTLGLCNIGATNLPVSIFHANDDPTVTVWASINAYNRAKACTIQGNSTMGLTLYNVGGHGIWHRVYDPNTPPFISSDGTLAPTIYEWMLSKKRVKAEPVDPKPSIVKATIQTSSIGEIKVPPPSEVKEPLIIEPMPDLDPVVEPVVVANAGGDFSAKIPYSILLRGSERSSGPIARILWTKQSGPAANIVNSDHLDTWINALNEGEYIFRLTLWDSKGNTSFDDVKVTVTDPNKPVVPVPTPPVLSRVVSEIIVKYTDGTQDSFKH